jgi:type I pantothenate kinase
MHSDLLRRPPRYHVFTRTDWASLRANTPLELSDADITALRGLNEPTSIADVTDVYLPPSRLLNLRIKATRSSVGVVGSAFLGRPTTTAPCS